MKGQRERGGGEVLTGLVVIQLAFTDPTFVALAGGPFTYLAHSGSHGPIQPRTTLPDSIFPYYVMTHIHTL